jgi:hypothetical protein
MVKEQETRLPLHEYDDNDDDITSSTNSKYGTAATLYTVVTWLV